MTTSMSVSSKSKLRLLADLSLLFIAAIWGATFFLVKDATRTFPVMAFLAIRFTLASIVLLPFVLRIGRKPTRPEMIWSILAGLAFCCGYIFQTFSLRLIDSGRAGFITGLYVILVPMLALVLLKHKLSLRTVIGAILATIGLGLLSNAPGGNIQGDILAFLCALSYALQIIAVERFPRNADWRIMAIIQSMCVALICGMFVPIQANIHSCNTSICASLQPFGEALPASIPAVVWAVAAFTGILATAFGLAIQVWAQRQLPPHDAALIFAMESPFAALFGWLFLNEVLTITALFGCGLILLGMLTTALSSEVAEIPPHEH
jgi:drug/metabolite transporter (DMT)-like permease